MAIPYQCIHAIGQDGVLCAARGGIIFTFSANGSVLSSWQHPKVQQHNGQNHEASKNGSDEQADGALPPLKKRKLENNSTENGEAKDEAEAVESVDVASSSKSQKKKGKLKKRDDPPAQEQPFVNVIQATPDGNYVVAVTGQDKAVWVFEHDGKGQLKELSQRIMPKRPCDLAFTSDNKTILVADKFGDVYSIPLIPSSAPQTDDSNATTARSNQHLVSKGANPLTVHSQRNLRALEDQRRQREKQQNVQKDSGPAFEHELIIGHVSMLTSIVVASSGGKQYILTADRDEHIRVSRGIPQAHVIENLCLGHTSFINALCIPTPEVLVSGGGDSELYFWNWRASTLNSKVDLLSHVQGVVPDATKIAVSKIDSTLNLSQPAISVTAICERVPAIFIVTSENDDSPVVQTIRLPGNPLDFAVMQTPGQPPRLIVSVNIDDTKEGTGPSPNLLVFHAWDSPPEYLFQETDVPALELTREELDKLLYTAENLRKVEFEDGGDDDGEGALVQGSEAGLSTAPES